MKMNTLFAAALVVVSGAVPAGGDHTAKHGGIVVATKALDFEIVAKPQLIQVYVKDHDKPVELDGAKGKITLLNGAHKTEVDLMPVGDKLEAKGSFKVANGTKGIASVTLVGKPSAVVRFQVR